MSFGVGEDAVWNEVGRFRAGLKVAVGVDPRSVPTARHFRDALGVLPDEVVDSMSHVRRVRGSPVMVIHGKGRNQHRDGRERLNAGHDQIQRSCDIIHSGAWEEGGTPISRYMAFAGKSECGSFDTVRENM